MARILGAEKNTLRLTDHISGSELELHYRLPDTRERVGYNNMFVRRQGNKVKMQATEARLKYGAKILLGFRAGDFADADGRPLASDPGEPGYREDWKDLVCAHAADIVEQLAIRVFDAPVSIGEDEDDDNDAADEEDNDEDPEKN